MGKVILYKKGKTAKTGRSLRKALRIYSNRSLEVGSIRAHNIDKLIRWGNSDELDGSFMELNSRESVSLSSNKLSSLKTLKENGVSVPWFTSDRGELATKHFKVVGRTTYHQGGSNFNIHDSGEEATYDHMSTHFLELIPIYKEYRVHVFKDEIIGISRKTDEGVEHRITNKYTRNHSNGWRFIRCDIEQMSMRLREIALEAVKTLGLDFGAVDIILSTGEESTSSGGKKFYVLEVNSAPSIETNSTIFQRYIDKINYWLRY